MLEEGWDLCVLIEDLQVTRRIRVRGDTHIGGVMLQLVEASNVKLDWSDHGLWWPEQNRWLLKTRRTLDQAGVQSDAKLEFHRMHCNIRLQLPDLQEREIRVNFAQSVFGVVIDVCKELAIRHPEELSLKRAANASGHQLGNNGTLGSRFGSFRRSKTLKASAASPTTSSPPAVATNGSYNPLVPRQMSYPSPRSPGGGSDGTGPVASPMSFNSLTFEGAELSYLANSPHVSARAAFAEKGLARPRSLAERAALNEAWLDSSRSLMEQGIRPTALPDTVLQLRFKFHSFYDLNAKYDSIRINQIYEQAKWSLLSEELECSEEEMLLLAALQLQVHLTAGHPAPSRGHSTLQRSLLLDEADTVGEERASEDDIDAALAELEASLMSDACLTLGSPKRLSSGPNNGQHHQQQHQQQQQQQQQLQQQSPGLNKVPELAGYLKYLRPHKRTLRGFRRAYFVLRETSLAMYSDQSKARQLEEFSLASVEVTPDVSATARKFGIRLSVAASPQEPELQELWLRCESKDQYADWTAGIGLAARGKTLASKGIFDAEVRATLAQLELQAPKPQARRMTLSSAPPDMDPADYVSPGHLKGRKTGWLMQRILERHVNVADRSLIEAKLDYIKVCQRLPLYGVAYFVVQCRSGAAVSPDHRPMMTFSEFRKEKSSGGGGGGGGRHVKEDLVAVAPNRLMRLDLGTGQVISTWRFEELQSWTINWEVLSVQLSLSRPPHGIVLLPCPSSDSSFLHSSNSARQSLCKTLAEFIGGYVFLSLRQPDKSQELSEQQFHKLTGSRDPNVHR